MTGQDQETDTEDDTDGNETKPQQEQPRRQIVLVQGEQTVSLEGPDDLDEMAKLAAYFWLLISPPKKVEVGFGAGSTLITERATPWEED